MLPRFNLQEIRDDSSIGGSFSLKYKNCRLYIALNVLGFIFFLFIFLWLVADLFKPFTFLLIFLKTFNIKSFFLFQLNWYLCTAVFVVLK